MTGGLEDVDAEVLEALRTLGQREMARPRPLCPRCVARESQRNGDWCVPCEEQRDAEQRDAAKAAKRRWWRKHGHDQRKEAKTNAN